MNDALRSILPSAVVLGAMGTVALFLTLTRDWADDRRMEIGSAARTGAVAIAAQAAHFAEELSTGFHERVPALFDLPPMSLRLFVSFNLAWLVIWSLSAWGLAARRRAALFPLWFLGIGCAVNVIAHPALSVFAGGYFPGLLTSPVVGVAGGMLLWRLHLVTRAVGSSTSAG